MNDYRSKTLAGRPAVIFRQGQSEVFSSFVLPDGRLVRVKSREVYDKALRAAGREIKQGMKSLRPPG